MADQPKARKTMVLMTDEEWRALRVAAAANDTSIQGYVTSSVLRRLTDEGNLKRGRQTRPVRKRAEG